MPSNSVTLFTDATMVWHRTIKFIHWITAIVVIGLIISGFVMVRFLEHSFELQFQTYQLHKSFGFLIFLLTFLRLFWRTKFPKKQSNINLTGIEIAAAKIAHAFFYFSLITMPILGWLSVSTSPLQIPTQIFGLLDIPHIFGPDDQLQNVFRTLHQIFGWLFAIAIVAHIGAALKHHYLDGNNILVEMLPFTSSGRGKSET